MPVRESSINWEQFLGAKLVAWIGGVALFFGIAFFIKYSFEHDLIPPLARIAIGAVTGGVLLCIGLLMRDRATATTAHTLCSTGILVLYGVSFAGHQLYGLYGIAPTFIAMALITAGAFLLSVRLDALVIAVLGVAGGFLTPALLHGPTNAPLIVYGYIAFLNIGLLTIALRQRWQVLPVLGTVGTLLMLLGRLVGFLFNSSQIPTVTMILFIGFLALFLAAVAVARWRSIRLDTLPGSTLAIGISAFISLIAIQSHAAYLSPLQILSALLMIDLGLLALFSLHRRYAWGEEWLTLAVFGTLAAWSSHTINSANLTTALIFYVAFAALHTGLPLLRARFLPDTDANDSTERTGHAGHPASRSYTALAAPAFALALILIPLLKNVDSPFMTWSTVFFLNFLALGVAAVTASLIPLIPVIVLSFIAVAIIGFQIPADFTDLTLTLSLLTTFSVLFMIGGAWLFRLHPYLAKNGQGEKYSVSAELLLPALTALFPFSILALLTIRLPLLSPSPIFAAALVIAALLLALSQWGRRELLAGAALLGVAGLESLWVRLHFSATAPLMPLTWCLAFYALFTAFPFFFSKSFSRSVTPWAVSALAGVLHFYPIHTILSEGYSGHIPIQYYIGLIPAAFAVAPLMGLAYLRKIIPQDNRAHRAHMTHLAQLAWMGGIALFFITLIFPLQFQREWITIGWALEGAALCWLFTRLPHPGLRIAGVALLVISFTRLALNPAVFEYHERAGAIWNWYLYTYGLAIVALFAGARYLALARANANAPADKNKNPFLTPGFLATLGTVLTFLLVNIEIADFFTPRGKLALTFEFTGNIARDLSYTIAWALFALGLLLIGIRRKIAAARYMSIGLLVATLGKLFLLDLWQLSQLYRIAAFIVVPIIAILASFLYQRFLSDREKPSEKEQDSTEEKAYSTTD